MEITHTEQSLLEHYRRIRQGMDETGEDWDGAMGSGGSQDQGDERDQEEAR